jgi:predicted Zn-dependent protease
LNYGRPILSLVLAAILTVAAGASRAQVNLPDIGSPADAILSKSDEARIGRAIMRNIRMSGQIVEDPQVNEYVNEIGHRIAAQANDGDHSFTFFVVDDPNINAFALPRDIAEKDQEAAIIRIWRTEPWIAVLLPRRG